MRSNQTKLSNFESCSMECANFDAQPPKQWSSWMQDCLRCQTTRKILHWHSIAGKILARGLLNRLLPLSEDIIPESQCGFRTSRGTTYMIFVARQIQEKSREQNKDLYMAIIDLIKDFRLQPWSSLESSVQIWLPHQLYHNPEISPRQDDSNVSHQRDWNKAFHHPYRGEAGLRYRTDSLHYLPMPYSFLSVTAFRVELTLTIGSMGDFNPSRLKAKTKVRKTAVINLQYADDCAILSHTAEELQTSLDLLTEAYQSLGLSVNIRKNQDHISTRSRQHRRTSWYENIWNNPRSCWTFLVLRDSSIPEGHHWNRNSTPYKLCQYILQETAPSSLR